MEKLQCYFYDQRWARKTRCENKAVIRQLYSTSAWQKKFHYCKKHRRVNWAVITVSPNGFYSRRKSTTPTRQKKIPPRVFNPLIDHEKKVLQTNEEFCRECKKSVYDAQTKTYFHTRCPCQIEKWPELYRDINLPEEYDDDHV